MKKFLLYLRGVAKKNQIIAGIVSFFRAPSSINNTLRDMRDMTLMYQAEIQKNAHPNPLNRLGFKCFSQADEDGITLEILRRIDCLEDGVFAEYGVGDGTENNTLILRALGWKGYWVGGQELQITNNLDSQKFHYAKAWITLDNLLTVTAGCMQALGESQLDVISLDFDGNDYYFVDLILTSDIKPKLFIVEYNAKFPPPVKWKIDYNSDHIWQGDDYFGVSLSSYVELFKRHGFTLICCNAQTGANAFFIRDDLRCYFTDIPEDIGEIYVGPRYFLFNANTHPPSLKTINSIFK